MAHIKQVNLDSGSYLIEPTLYAAATVSSDGKTYTASFNTNFELVNGVCVQIKCPNKTNTAPTTFNTKNIYYNEEAIASNTLKANHTYALVYDGTQWQLVGDIDTNTTYTNGTGLNLNNGEFSVKYGNEAGTAVQGNDPRLSDARTPTSHSHGNITNDGKVGNGNTLLKTVEGTVQAGPTLGTDTTKFLNNKGEWAVPAYTTNTDEKVKQNSNTENKEFSILLKTTNNATSETGEVKFGAATDKLVTINPSTGRITAPGGLAGDASSVNGHTVLTDVPANAVFTDTKSFTITASATDGYWDLTGTNGTNAVTYALAPYSSKQSGANFYTGTTNPDGTTRLNYNGYLYATKLYSGGTEVSVSGHTHSYAGSSSAGGAATTATTTANTTDEIYILGVKSGATTTLLHDTKITATGGKLMLTGGGLEIKGHIAGDSGAAGHGLYSGGVYHNAYNNIILHGDATTGSSGIAFVSDKVAADGTVTNINQPSDRAFIQYHAYGVTTATAEGTAPTLATSGEAGRLVIGIGNDASGDKIVLQAPGDTDIIHQKGATGYPIPHTTNTNGTVGRTTTPVYVEAGVIKAGTALKDLAYIAKGSGSTKFLREDGTWQTALTSHQSLSAYAPLNSPTFTGTPKSVTPTSTSDDTMIATKAYVDGYLAVANALVYKGIIAGAATGDNNAYGALTPAANCGDTYKISTAGFINGLRVEVGDMLICTTDNTPAATASGDNIYSTIRNNWNIIQTSEGSVSTSSTSSTDNAIARFDGTSGRIIKSNSYTTLDDNGHISITHKAGSSTELQFKYSTTIDYWWGVGTGNENHGLYDVKASKWILSAGANNTWTFVGNVTGNADTATTATNVTGIVAIVNGGTGKTTASEAWTALGGGASGKHADSYFALASHGNHVPATQTANNITFLRNDNSWYKLTSTEVSTLINLLSTGDSELTADDYIITQYVGGGTTTTTYHRRKASKVINSTLVKAALGTDSSTTNQWLNKKGNWSAPTAAEVGAAPAVSGGYLPLSGGTMTGALTFKNGTYNVVGDDCAFGDINEAGTLAFKGQNGQTKIKLVPYSGSTANYLSIDGAGNLTISGTTKGTFSGNVTGTATYAYGIVSLGRRASADYNPSTETYGYKITSMLASSSMTTSYPGLEGAILNFPWDWGGYNGQLALTVTNVNDGARMRIRNAQSIDNGESASPRYTPNYSAWREIVTMTIDSAIGGTNAPIYVDAKGRVQACTTYANATVAAAGKATNDSDGNAINSTYLKLSGGTMTGLITAKVAATHTGIKLGNTYLTAIDGNIIFQNNGSIRFGTDAWDYNQWAGLKYVHSTKTISLGLADGTVFTANSAQSAGTLNFPGIDKIVLTKNSGGIYKYYGAASNAPTIQVNSNNLDVSIIKIDGDNPTDIRDSQAYGFNLKYIGTGSGAGNTLRLIADNSNGTDVTAMEWSGDGKVGIGTTYNTSYRLYVNGTSYLNGATTIATNLAGNSADLTISSSNALASGYQWGINHVVPNLGTGANTCFITGKSNTSKKQAVFGFHYDSGNNDDGSLSYVDIGMYSANGLIKVYGNGNVSIGGTNNSYKLHVNGTSYLGNTTTIYGPLKIGAADAAANTGYATADVGSQNYIAFYGVYGDGAGSYNHTYIGESIYGSKTTANEQSELLLFHGNDPGNPDRIRLLAGQIDLCVYTAATSGTWDTIRQTAGTKVANFANGQVTITGNLLPEANNTRNIGSSSVKWANIYATTFTGALTGNATTCSYPAGFTGRGTGATWGNQVGTSLTYWNTTNGGCIDFRYDNPSSGKVSIKVDGRFYGNEGTYPTMLMRSENGYWGLCDPDATNSVWIRTTTQGIIPYQAGGEGGGHCGLGTSSWYFSSAYVDTAYNTKVIIKNKVTLQWNDTDQSLDFVFA